MGAESRPLFRAAVFLLLLGFYCFFLAHKIQWVTADLGRHLKNGELFFKSFLVPRTNLYSYTFPDFPFVNHHWATGVVFYAVARLGGFEGLSIFFIAVSLATFGVFFALAASVSSFETAAFVSAFMIPCLGTRVEIRPELFSYLFCGLDLAALWLYRDGKVSKRVLFWATAVIEMLWVNFHIYFFMGPALAGIFCAEALLDHSWKKLPGALERAKTFAVLIAVLSVLPALNPRGAVGALYPLHIFQNFGYRLFEDQSVRFIERLFPYPPARYFRIAFWCLVLSWLARYVILAKAGIQTTKALDPRQRLDRGEGGGKNDSLNLRCSSLTPRPSPLVPLVLSVAMGAWAWLAVRNFALFAYFALPIASANLAAFFVPHTSPFALRPLSWLQRLLPALGAAAVAVMVLADPAYFAQERASLGLGLAPGSDSAAQFYLNHNIQGPVLNNYDNGSYLVYYLYPNQGVFVDNRPEAYPASFFEKTYVPLQQDDLVWREAQARWGFNAIFFYWHDVTPWGQNFLIHRVRDREWAPIYVDAYNLILVKRNAQNAPLIAKYELPQTLFKVK